MSQDRTNTEAMASRLLKSNTNNPPKVRPNAGMQGQRRGVHRFKYTKRGGAQVKQIRVRLTVLLSISITGRKKMALSKDRSFGINKIFWEVHSVLCVCKQKKKKTPKWHDAFNTVLKLSCPYQRLKQLIAVNCKTGFLAIVHLNEEVNRWD